MYGEKIMVWIRMVSGEMGDEVNSEFLLKVELT